MCLTQDPSGVQDKKHPARTAAQATAAQELANRAPAIKRAFTEAETPQLHTSKRMRCADDVATMTVNAYAGAIWCHACVLMANPSDPAHCTCPSPACI